MIRIKSQLTVFVLFVFFVLKSTAQMQYQKYEGPYEALPGLKGKALFKFRDDGKLRIKEGEFQFIWKEKDEVCHSHFSKTTWDGLYSSNEKEGSWEYLKEKHSFTLNEIDSFQIDHDLTTIRNQFLFEYQKGLPNGEWVAHEKHYENANQKSERRHIYAPFKNGKVNGIFSISDTSSLTKSNYFIKGSVVNGLMDSTWIFEFGKDEVSKEVREYQSGFLKRIIFIKNEIDTLKTIDFPLSPKIIEYLDSTKNSKATVNSPVSMSFSDGYPRTSTYYKLQQKGNKYLQDAIDEIMQFDPQIVKKYGLVLGTNRMLYPLSKVEEDLTEVFTDNYNDYSSDIDEYKHQIELNLRYNQNEKLQLFETWVEVQDSLIKYIKPWKNIVRRKELDFYNREGLLKEYVESIIASDTLNLSQKDSIINYSSGIDSLDLLLDFMSKNLAQRNNIGDSLYKDYQTQISSLKLESDLSGLQYEIGEKFRILDSLYHTNVENKEISNMFNSCYHSFILKLHTEYQNLFNGKVVDKNTAKKLADSLLYNANIMYKAYFKWIKVADRHAKLDELYTEYVFDPYTFSENVPQRVSKKFFTTMVTQVFDGMINNARSCDDAVDFIEEVHILLRIQNRVMSLRDREHDRLKVERKIRKNMTLEEKMEILDL